jgi:hypothetical protein
MAGVKPLLSVQVFLTISYENRYDARVPQANKMKMVDPFSY